MDESHPPGPAPYTGAQSAGQGATNLAQGKRAYSSSAISGPCAHTGGLYGSSSSEGGGDGLHEIGSSGGSSVCSAPLAVDGITSLDSNRLHTDPHDGQAWLSVDLGATELVSRVIIHHRWGHPFSNVGPMSPITQ
jgi:hypothetical protein